MDIVARLQLQAAATNWSNGGSKVANLLCEAARKIERLREGMEGPIVMQVYGLDSELRQKVTDAHLDITAPDTCAECSARPPYCECGGYRPWYSSEANALRAILHLAKRTEQPKDTPSEKRHREMLARVYNDNMQYTKCVVCGVQNAQGDAEGRWIWTACACAMQFAREEVAEQANGSVPQSVRDLVDVGLTFWHAGTEAAATDLGLPTEEKRDCDSCGKPVPVLEGHSLHVNGTEFWLHSECEPFVRCVLDAANPPKAACDA